MRDDHLKLLGYITTLPEQDQLNIKNCKIALEEVMSRYDEGAACIALALIGFEKEGE